MALDQPDRRSRSARGGFLGAPARCLATRTRPLDRGRDAHRRHTSARRHRPPSGDRPAHRLPASRTADLARGRGYYLRPPAFPRAGTTTISSPASVRTTARSAPSLSLQGIIGNSPPRAQSVPNCRIRARGDEHMLEQALSKFSGKSLIREKFDNFIGGQWVPRSRSYLDDISPVTGRRCTEVAAQYRRGHRARARRRPPAAARAGARLHSQDVRSPPHNRRPDGAESSNARDRRVRGDGKPIREALAADLPLAVDHLRYFAACVRRRRVPSPRSTIHTVAYHFHEPLGVVGQIIPWNYPLLMATWKLAPGAGRGQLRGAQARRADTHCDPGVARSVSRFVFPPASSTW